MTLSMKSTTSTWESLKPKIVYLIVGLVAGPILSGMFGLQVLTSTAANQVEAGIVDLQATYCAVNARTEKADANKLDYTARNELAKKYAVMPGGGDADFNVVSACAKKLAS
jgi:hypothetical protein